MKRFTILIAMIVFAYSLQGQNDAKYVYHFSGGITIGGVYKGAKNVKIDSLINDAGVLKFYSGGVEVPVSGSVDTTNLSIRVDSMLNKTGTAWRVLYRNTSGVITELALGADGTYLKSNGATSAPTFSTPEGSGDVSKVGTPVDNQVGVFTGDGTIEGTSGLTYDGTSLKIDTSTVAKLENITNAFTAAFNGAELGVALPDSNVYDGGYQTPRGTDVKLAVKQNIIPDSVAYTANSTLALTDANKLVVCTKATSIIITIPTHATAAIPIGTTINFVQGGAGIIVFKGSFHSKKDSTATGGIYSWAALYKRGENNWLLYGDIED